MTFARLLASSRVCARSVAVRQELCQSGLGRWRGPQDGAGDPVQNHTVTIDHEGLRHTTRLERLFDASGPFLRHMARSYPSDSFRVLECLLHVFDGVVASFPGHVQKTLPMELKTEVVTARMAWLNPLPK